MSVSVYFSNQIIQIAVGRRGRRGTLQRVYTTMAPEGSIINGIVMDSTALAEHMKGFWNAQNLPKKDVYLIVNSNKIAGKNIEIPNLNQKKTLKFIRREFSDMQREESENTVAYIPIGYDKKTKLNHIYAELAPKDQLRELMDIFVEIGITLKGIISGEGSIIGYAQMTLAKQSKTFILQVVNGNLVSNVLFVDGEFKYYNSVRCFNDIGTEAYLEDLARSLNQLEQFMQTQKIESAVEKIYIAGTSRDDISYYSQIVREHGVTAPCELVNTGMGTGTELQHESERALFALSGLYDQGSSSNFLSFFSQKDDKESLLDPQMKRRIITVVSALIFMLICFGVALTMRLIRTSQYEEVRDYNVKPNVVQQTSMYDAEVERRDSMLAKYNSLNTIILTLDSYPVCSDDIIEILENDAKGYAQIEINSFNADEGSVNFSAKATSVNDIYKYIDKLLLEDIFKTVEHTGYTYDSKANLYNIHVNCTLAGSVGRKTGEDD
jgi:hypothetical protein